MVMQSAAVPDETAMLAATLLETESVDDPDAAATAVAHAAPPAKSTRPAECGSMTSAVTQRKTLCSQRKCA